MEPTTRRVPQPTGVLEDEGVEVVLLQERITHALVRGQQSDAADPPVQAGAFRGVAPGIGPGVPAHEPVKVGGLMGAVKAAHADVDDPSGCSGTVIVGSQGRLSQ